MAWFSSFFSSQGQNIDKQGTTLDLITYTASLASNPRDIDPLLDKVREISSRLQPGQTLSAQDEKTLSAVYGQLEKYLVEKEQIRKFTAEEVRQRVRAKFPGTADKVIGAGPA